MSIEVLVLEGLENHNTLNKLVLDMLSESQVSYRYTRWSFEDRYGGQIDDAMAQEWNVAMAKAQRVRLQPSDEVGMVSLEGDDAGIFEEGPMSFGEDGGME